MCQELTVLKFGGSVLRGEEDLRTAVHEVYRWLRTGGKVVVVVSAFEGTTDRLIRQAQAVDPRPDPVANPLLLATGELTTAALVVLALQRAGVPATVLGPAAVRLRTDGAGVDANPVSVNTRAIYRALAQHSVVVIPGFVGVDEDQQFTLLGRGGSDLTALFIAHELSATRCRLIKDVDGLYERDPALPGPRPRRFKTISWQDALKLDEGIVQHKALRFAQRSSLSFEVGAFNAADTTSVGAHSTALVNAGEVNEPLRVALLGLGTVGLGVYQSLVALPHLFNVVSVGVRDAGKALAAGVPGDLIETVAAAASSDCDVVVELIGGIEPATQAITSAISSGKSVVTANKALVAKSGHSLHAQAAGRGVSLRHSAAVGGSVPMLELVTAFARENSITRIEGVLNGTCNYVLNQVGAGLAFEEAVALAQRAGFAEADPTRDLSGTDAAEKLVLLARAGFDAKVTVDDLKLTPLSGALLEHLRASAGGDRVFRQIAWIERDAQGSVRGGVEIVPVAATSEFANLPGATNRLEVIGNDGTRTSLTGAGAGRWPTTESVLADLLDLARELNPGVVQPAQEEPAHAF